MELIIKSTNIIDQNDLKRNKFSLNKISKFLLSLPKNLEFWLKSHVLNCRELIHTIEFEKLINISK